MPILTPVAPAGGYVQLKAPSVVLAPPSEFIYDGTQPIAHRMRFGANWVGLDTMGEVLSVSEKREATEANLANSNNGSRGKRWTGLGWSADLTLQHDRGMPHLDVGHKVTMWILFGDNEDGDQVPEKKRFYVAAVGHKMGDTETAMYTITIKYEEGLMDDTSNLLVRAKLDQFGRVIVAETGDRVTASATAPGSVLPTDNP